MIKYGIIGAGKIAKKFARDIRLAENSKLVAIASRSIEKASMFQEEFDLEYSFGSYEAMVKSDVIDAVYIATPHSFHKEHSILAMRNNKHVLCEKPIATSVFELDEMIKVSKEFNVLLMEAMWSRFLPSTLHVNKLLQSEEFGEIKHIDFSFGFEIDEDYPEDGRLLNPKLAGGSILDLLVYPVSMMCHFKQSKVEEIVVNSDLNEDDIDLDTEVRIVFEDKTTAHLHSSIAQELDDVGVIILDNGKIQMKKFYHCTEMCVNKNKVSTPCLGEGFVHQIEAFSKTLMSGLTENDVMTHKASRDVMLLLDEINRLARL